MNKKLFGMMAIAATLFAASCSDDARLGDFGEPGSEATVQFSLGLEGNLMSRAIGDGQQANHLVYQLYDASGNPIGEQGEQDVTSWPTTISFTLLRGSSYKIAFWAQNADVTCYDTNDLQAVTIDFNGALNNDDARDAFFTNKQFTVSAASQQISATLTRPFAQINLGITKDDYTKAEESGFKVVKTNMNVTGGYSTINLLTGEVSNPLPISFDFNDIPDQEEETLVVKVNGVQKEYVYLSTSYILVPEESSLLEKLSFSLHPEEGADMLVTNGINNAPVMRNWRTNIVGNLLTGDVDITIERDPMFDGDYDYPDFESLPAGLEYDADTKTATVTSVQALKWLSDATNGDIEYNPDFGIPTVKRSINGQQIDIYDFTNIVIAPKADSRAAETVYDLSGITDWKPIYIKGYQGVFDGGNDNGVVIANLTVEKTGKEAASFVTGFVSTYKNITLRNVNISGNYSVAAVTTDSYATVENCHVDGGLIVSTPWKATGSSVYDDGNNAGAILAFWNGDANNYSITGCSAKNLTVKAFRKVGGIVGYVGSSTNTISNCTVEKVQVIADMTETNYDSYETRQPQAGIIAGNEDEISSSITGCTTDNNPEVSVIRVQDGQLIINTVEDLKAFALSVNTGNTYKGSTVLLNADLDLANEAWTPIGNGTYSFQGTFDGNNKTIKNLYVSMPGKSYVGLFGNTSAGEVKNLTVENADIEGRLNVGVVSGNPHTAKYNNITVKGKVTVDGFSYVGGVFGKNLYANADKITVDVEPGSYVKAYSIEDGSAYRTYVGGVVGFMGEGNITVSNVTSNIDVYGSTMDAGGLTGIAHYDNSFENCTVNANVTITHALSKSNALQIGGIAATWHNATGHTVTFTDCAFDGKLTVNADVDLGGYDLDNNKITGVAYSASTSTGQLIIDGQDKTAEHQQVTD